MIKLVLVLVAAAALSGCATLQRLQTAQIEADNVAKMCNVGEVAYAAFQLYATVRDVPAGEVAAADAAYAKLQAACVDVTDSVKVMDLLRFVLKTIRAAREAAENG